MLSPFIGFGIGCLMPVSGLISFDHGQGSITRKSDDAQLKPPFGPFV
jgi:hypothetical protein